MLEWWFSRLLTWVWLLALFLTAVYIIGVFAALNHEYGVGGRFGVPLAVALLIIVTVVVVYRTAVRPIKPCRPSDRTTDL